MVIKHILLQIYLKYVKSCNYLKLFLISARPNNTQWWDQYTETRKNQTSKLTFLQDQTRPGQVFGIRLADSRICEISWTRMQRLAANTIPAPLLMLFCVPFNTFLSYSANFITGVYSGRIRTKYETYPPYLEHFDQNSAYRTQILPPTPTPGHQIFGDRRG